MTYQSPPPHSVGGGRHPAAAIVRHWTHDALRPALYMVTGSPASGKSHLIAELMADDAFAARFHAFVPLRGMTVASATCRYVDALYPPVLLYTGGITMIVGNFLMIYCMMAGCMERGLFPAVRTMFTIPFYWALMSAAAYKALAQLALPSRRHFWELTDHGLVHQSPAADPRPTTKQTTPA